MSTTSAPDRDLAGVVAHLSELSVRKHFDAYVDVPWDEHPIEQDDPRWALPDTDPLARTVWYRSLAPATQARLGLFAAVSKMKTGLEFENVLCRGLLEFVGTLPNGSPEFRYAMHELIEEGQHQLMFQEFVNRSRIDVAGMPWYARLGSRFVVTLGRRFPELFFMFVLGGEDPIDHLQRQSLAHGGVHPLSERIMRIHVTEEARHLSFARHYLKHRVGRLSRGRRLGMAFGTPLILGEMGRLMLMPSPQMVREFAIPPEVLREAYVENPEFRRGAAISLRKVRLLAGELGLLTPFAIRLWKARNIWADDGTLVPGASTDPPARMSTGS